MNYKYAGIYASDINGMSVSNETNEKPTSIKSPTTTLNNTRLNSAVTGSNISNNQEANRSESQLSTNEKVELDNSQTKVHSRQSSSSRFMKRTLKSTSSSKKHEKEKANTNFRFTPTKPKTDSSDASKRPVTPPMSVQPKGFRPSSVFKLKTKFLKSTLPNPSTPSLLSARNNSSGLKNLKSENESFLSKTVLNDKDSENSNTNSNENAESDAVNSFDNLSNLIEDTQIIHKTSHTNNRSKSIMTISNEKTSPSYYNSSTSMFMPIKHAKTNLVNEILQTQSYSSLSKNNSSAMGGRNSEQDLIIDHLSEEEFVKLLKQYRSTKDPRLINQLATPTQQAAMPLTRITLSESSFISENNRPNIEQKLKVPKTNNILFTGKSEFSNGFVRYYNTGDYISDACLEPVTTTVDIDTNQIIPVNKIDNTVPIRNKSQGSKQVQEPTFFVNYINKKYNGRKCDSTFMEYFLSNKNFKKNSYDHLKTISAQSFQPQQQQAYNRPSSVSTIRTFNTGYLFNIQATTTA